MTQQQNPADNEINREQAEQKIQEKEQERLRRLRYQATDTKKDWVDKLANGETRKYRFVYDERTGYKVKHFKEGDQGRILFHFYVFDLGNPDQLKYGKDQEFLLAKTHAVAILNELLAGHFDLEITRYGTGNFDTRYEVRPIVTTTAAPTPAA